jgi:hypothetical protein
MLTVKKHLSLKPLIEGFKKAFKSHYDKRRQKSIEYSVHDTALSVLACMFYKSRSLLRFQSLLKQRTYRNNLETQFGVYDTPTDNHIRSIIAEIPVETYAPVFSDYLQRLQRSKHLQKYRFLGKYLLAIDATQYHFSHTIHCSACLTKEHNGKIEYSHQALQPIICHPDNGQILPLMPEAIKNEDGTDKQDCEINAAKRLLPKIRKQHPRMEFIWLADSIYATAPFIKTILDEKEEFIFRVKKGDHRSLYRHIETAEYESHRNVMGNTTIAYRWYKNVPLNKSTDIKVTVIQAFVIKKDKNGKQISTMVGVWITNIMADQANIAEITRAARSRWKVENQCFNSLKNCGYELTHNWGHVNGEAFNFYVVLILAFYIHQILELTDNLFQWCRKVCRTYAELWEDLRVLFKMTVFDSWEHMLARCIEVNGFDPPEIV